MPLYPMKFAFTPGLNERVEAVVTVPREQRAIVHGTVYDTDGCRIADAVVRLFVCQGEVLEPVAHTLTDGDGEFVFGAVDSDKSYVVKVYVNGVMFRDIIIRPKKNRTRT